MSVKQAEPELNNAQKILLLIIREAKAKGIEGDTRLQKISFLVDRLVKKARKLGFYSDWRPDKFGPFSPQLARDAEILSPKYLAVNSEMKEQAGYLKTYMLTKEGEEIANSFAKKETSVEKAISSIVTSYSHAPLLELIHDVYYRYPEYTIKSRITGSVAAQDYALRERKS